jgi:hypothetical protein
MIANLRRVPLLPLRLCFEKHGGCEFSLGIMPWTPNCLTDVRISGRDLALWDKKEKHRCSRASNIECVWPRQRSIVEPTLFEFFINSLSAVLR